MTEPHLLETFPFFVESPGEVRESMARAALPTVIGAGDFFYRGPGRCPHFAVVTTGNIRVYRSGEGGREVTLYHVRDGEPCLVNLLSVMLDAPAMAEARAEVETAAIAFPRAMLDPWMAASASLRQFVFGTIAARMAGVMSLVEEIAFRHVDRRVAALLLRHGERGRVIAVTHQEIASEVGTAREVVSRVLAEFARRGAIVSARGRIQVRDEELLRQVN